MRALQELIPNCNKVSFFPSDFALLRYTWKTVLNYGLFLLLRNMECWLQLQIQT